MPMPRKPSTNTEIALLKQRLDEIEGPIKETLERVRQALVGTEDGSQQGLLARVLLVEAALDAAKLTLADIQAQLKAGDVRMDNVDLSLVSIKDDTKSLKETRTELKKGYKHWKWLIIGAIVTGAIGLGWAWAEKKFLDDKKPRTEHSAPK